MHEQFQPFITVLYQVNPVICVPMFARALPEQWLAVFDRNEST